MKKAQANNNPLEHLMAGRYDLALEGFRQLSSLDTSENSVALEALCAVAASGAIDEAAAGLGEHTPEDLSAAEKARYLTAQAYVEVHKGQPAEAIRLLSEAVHLDPSFPLAHLSLGRHLLLKEQDQNAGRTHLQKAAELAPWSSGAQFGLVTLEAETGNFKAASRAAHEIVRQDPASLRALTAWITAALSASPLGGRIPILVLALTAFVPYIGPIVGLVWLGYTILALVTLRHTSPRLALYPLLALVVFLATYILRWIIYGNVFP